MSAHNDLDRRLAAAFEDGPARAPERSIALALEHARAHPRRVDLLASIRKDPMTTGHARITLLSRPLAFVGVVALVLAAVFAAASIGGFFRDSGTVIPPSATPSPTSVRSPSPTPGISPSPMLISVDLIEHVGADASIEITDLSGTLVGAQSGDPGDGASVPDGTVVANRPAADPTTIVLTWSGLPCDTEHQLTIEPDGVTMTIERPACGGDSLPVDRVLQLTFNHPVDPTAIIAVSRTTGN